MERPPQTVCLLLLVAAAVVLGAAGFRWRQARALNVAKPSLPAAFSEAMPARVLWAWEEPEDLHALPPTVGVAYLAETLLVGDLLIALPRRQPLRTALDARVMAVVRIEARAGFVDTPELRASVATRLAEIGRRNNLRALQVDFDANASQREFYAGVLKLLKPQLPLGLPLSITALVSWCGADSWLHGLPIDEAVPMFFRMGGPRAISSQGPRFYRLAEPLCRGSVGVATDEPWPANFNTLNSSTRVYIFAPRPWRDAQFAVVSSLANTSLAQELVR